MTIIRDDNDVPARYAIKLILQFLNINYREHDGHLYFKYHDAYFESMLANTGKSLQYYDTHFDSMQADTGNSLRLTTTLDYVDEGVLYDCFYGINELNEKFNFAKITYSPAYDGGKSYAINIDVDVYLVGDVEKDAVVLCCMLDNCVSLANEYAIRREYESEDSKHRVHLEQMVQCMTTDQEDEHAYLFDGSKIYSPKHTLTMGELLSIVDDFWLRDMPLSMKIQAGIEYELTDTDQVLLFDVFAPMKRNECPKNEMPVQQVTYIIQSGAVSLFITFIPQYEEDGHVYIMVAFYARGYSYGDSALVPSTRSMTLIYDPNIEDTSDAWDAEPWAEYWDGIDISVADDIEKYCINLGTKYMTQKHYLNAIIYLEHAYRVLVRVRGRYNKNCYLLAKMMGTCYNKLGLYTKAYYYTHLLFEQGEYSDVPAYMETLIGLSDPRYEEILNTYTRKMKELLEDDDHPSRELRRICTFIFQTYVKHYFKKQRFEKVASMLSFMEENCPYEKEYVKSMRIKLEEHKDLKLQKSHKQKH